MKTPSKNGYVPTGKPRGRRPGQKNKIKDNLASNDDPMTENSEEGKDDGSPLTVPENQKNTKSGYIPTGKPRGRRPGQKNKTKDILDTNDDSINENNDEGKDDGSPLSVPENRKKTKSGYVPTGKPRGRRPGQKNKTKDILDPNDDPMNENNEEGKDDGSPLTVPENQRKSKNGYVPTGKPRGRKPGQKNKNKISVPYNMNDDAHTNEKREERRKEREERRKEDELALPSLPEVQKKRKYDYIPTGMPRGRRPGQKNKKTISAERRREAKTMRRVGTS